MKQTSKPSEQNTVYFLADDSQVSSKMEEVFQEVCRKTGLSLCRLRDTHDGKKQLNDDMMHHRCTPVALFVAPHFPHALEAVMALSPLCPSMSIALLSETDRKDYSVLPSYALPGIDKTIVRFDQSCLVPYLRNTARRSAQRRRESTTLDRMHKQNTLPSVQKYLESQQSTTYLRHLLDAIPDAVLITDASDFVSVGNAAMGSMFGSWESHMGAPAADTLQDAAIVKAAGEVRKSLSSDKPTARVEDVVLQRKDGTTYFSVRVSLMLDESDRLIGYLYLLRDMTKEHEYRTHLEQSETALEEKVQERTKELRKKIEELELYYKTTVDRELKMVELKKENTRLMEQLGSEESVP